MRTFLIFLGLWLGMAAGVSAAESLTLADGTPLSGDIAKADDVGVMIHTTSDTYTNLQWDQFSQETLKQLAANPKLRAYVEPLIEPTAADRPPVPNIHLKEVERMTLPAHPSILGGPFQSSLGLFILLLIYAANLYGAYEVAVVRGKPVAAVMGLSAVLPIVGPIIFLAQPMQAAPAEESAPEEGAPGAPDVPGTAAPGATAPGATPGAAPLPGQEEIQIVSASWQPSEEVKKPQPQVFSRGKFTLNRRFIETKFAGFIGEPKGDAKNFSMEVRTLKDTLAVECIKQVGATEAILETPNGQLTLPFADIQEIRLIPKTA